MFQLEMWKNKENKCYVKRIEEKKIVALAATLQQGPLGRHGMCAKMTTYIDLSDGNINHATHNN